MTKPAEASDLEIADHDAICSTTTIAALLMLGAQFPHRQFNSAELCILSGVGRTAMSQIKNASDTPFSLGKCTLQRLDGLACETSWSEARVATELNPEAAMSKGFRKNISIPGLLALTSKQRAAEFGDAGFAPYVVELVCYDLRAAAHHSITLAIADDTQAAQDAVDQELVARYKPGQARAGLLVQVAKQLQGIAARSRHDLPLATMSAVSERVTFPADIWPLAKERWQALGYRTLSAYITALIRYDLLVGGPHAYATGECRSKVQRAITRKTVAARRKGGQRKILLDHLIERAKGRRVPKEELEEVKAQIARTLRESLTKRL